MKNFPVETSNEAFKNRGVIAPAQVLREGGLQQIEGFRKATSTLFKVIAEAIPEGQGRTRLISDLDVNLTYAEALILRGVGGGNPVKPAQPNELDDLKNLAEIVRRRPKNFPAGYLVELENSIKNYENKPKA